MNENPVGRPLKFKTCEQLDAKIDEYFTTGRRVVTKYDKDGKSYDVAKVTLTDLCIFLGFCDKCSFYDYEKKPEFSHSIKRARIMVEREYEERLETQYSTGAIFALKNFGWRDKQDIDLSSSDGSMTPAKTVRYIIDKNGNEVPYCNA